MAAAPIAIAHVRGLLSIGASTVVHSLDMVAERLVIIAESLPVAAASSSATANVPVAAACPVVAAVAAIELVRPTTFAVVELKKSDIAIPDATLKSEKFFISLNKPFFPK